VTADSEHRSLNASGLSGVKGLTHYLKLAQGKTGDLVLYQAGDDMHIKDPLGGSLR